MRAAHDITLEDWYILTTRNQNHVNYTKEKWRVITNAIERTTKLRRLCIITDTDEICDYDEYTTDTQCVVEVMKSLAKNTSISTLDVTCHSPWKEPGDEFIKALDESDHVLSKLMIRDVVLTQKGIDSIARMIRRGTIVNVLTLHSILSSTHPISSSHLVWELCDAIASSPTFHTLTLSLPMGGRQGVAMAAHLGHLLATTERLTDFTLVGIDMDDEAMKLLANGVKKNRSLYRLAVLSEHDQHAWEGVSDAENAESLMWGVFLNDTLSAVDGITTADLIVNARNLRIARETNAKVSRWPPEFVYSVLDMLCPDAEIAKYIYRPNVKTAYAKTRKRIFDYILNSEVKMRRGRKRARA